MVLVGGLMSIEDLRTVRTNGDTKQGGQSRGGGMEGRALATISGVSAAISVYIYRDRGSSQIKPYLRKSPHYDS